ncbi:hypothetical protein VKT23_016438 [Stygiomarasmius scandens]|uniref:Uncharacterized protein n=1 Tax=Marasmiellus scandens TaxID=2682957 RepID=A0ABR1IV27_9AGAR
MKRNPRVYKGSPCLICHQEATPVSFHQFYYRRPQTYLTTMMSALGIRASTFRAWSHSLPARFSMVQPRSPSLCRAISTTPFVCTDGHIETPSNAELRAAQDQASVSPLAPIGVAAAVEAKANPSSVPARPKIFDEFALRDRVGIISGGNRGLGLEMAMALCEAGARAVYCLDVTKEPSEDWVAVKDFVGKMGSRLEYMSVDVRDQKAMWGVGEKIGDKEGRMDFCVAAAGILKQHTPCLGYPEKQFRDVSTNTVPFAMLTNNAQSGHGYQCKWCIFHGPGCW